MLDADDILVLENGRVKERGRHEMLLKDSSSLYAYLWDRQSQGYLKTDEDNAETLRDATGTKPWVKLYESLI